MSRVALVGENSIGFIRTLINIWNNGECAVLIDSRIPPPSAVEMMIEAKVKKCYVGQRFYDKFADVTEESISLIPYAEESASAQLLPHEVYKTFCANYTSDEAVVIYSSGTTGKSKGIILSHFAINTNADAIIDYMRPKNDDCLYIVKSLNHSSAITGELLVALKTEIPLLIAPIVVPPRYTLRNIEKYGVTIVGVNPLLLTMYCEECIRGTYDISCLKKLYVSGSILNDKTYELAHRVFRDKEIYNVYGLSEAGPRVTAQRSDCCKSNSVGKAIQGVEVVVVDENGNPVEIGENGIVHVKTPSVFDGYIQGEQKHKSLYRGWLNTGDIGYVDDAGELYIVGRIDDMIVIDSHKIYPSEVEMRIIELTMIKECSVAKVEYNGNEFVGCLYADENEIGRDIKGKLKTKLLTHEIPRFFLRCDSLPRTKNGKVSMLEVQARLKRYIGQE